MAAAQRFTTEDENYYLNESRSMASSKYNIMQKCNLCKRVFKTQSKWDRFCKGCKRGSELFAFAEWLPE